MILLSCGVCVCVHVSSLISSLVIEHGSFFHFPRMSLFKYLGMMTVMSMFINILYLQTVKQRIGSIITSSNFHFLWTHYPGGLVTSSDYSERLEEYPFFPRHQQVHTHTYIQKIKILFPLPLLFTINFAIYSFFFDTQRVLPMALGKLVRGISNCFVYETLL